MTMTMMSRSEMEESTGWRRALGAFGIPSAMATTTSRIWRLPEKLAGGAGGSPSVPGDRGRGANPCEEVHPRAQKAQIQHPGGDHPYVRTAQK